MGSGLGYTGHIHKQFNFTKYVSQNIYTTCTKLNSYIEVLDPIFCAVNRVKTFFFIDTIDIVPNIIMLIRIYFLLLVLLNK